MPSRDKLTCMDCVGTAKIQEDSTYRDCVCPLYSRIVEDLANKTKSCLECDRNAYQGQEAGTLKIGPVYECLYCPTEKNKTYSQSSKPWNC